ncbi:hypothetical protein LTR66_002921 [Elasticomyces elasticus]|nr:hypothetical protein LTR66_002921 [Elasticomyces elasticus]
MANGEPKVIMWDYNFAPNAQKSRNYLYAAKIPFQQCDQPFALPRPILTDLGITYRRIPVISIGKDFYCDNSSFLAAGQQIFEKKALKKGKSDSAFEAFGYRNFWTVLSVVPASLVTEAMKKDRTELFPIFARDDFASLRPNGLSELRAVLDVAENEFLGDDGPFIGGEQQVGMADVHAVWVIKWVLQTLEISKEKGFGKEDFPRVYRWIESFPLHAEQKLDQLSAEDAQKQVLGAEYAAKDIGVEDTDPLGFKSGDQVSVEPSDAKPHTHPQVGKLVGLSKQETVIQLENGLRVHFPKVGYVVSKA